MNIINLFIKENSLVYDVTQSCARLNMNLVIIEVFPNANEVVKVQCFLVNSLNFNWSNTFELKPNHKKFSSGVSPI